LASYDNLADIRMCKRFDKVSRAENALLFLEQIKNHKLFKVGNNVVEISFADTERTLSSALISHFRRI